MSGARLSIALANTKARLYGRVEEFRPAVSSAWLPVDEGRWLGSEVARERGGRVEGVVGAAEQLGVVSSLVVVLLQFNFKGSNNPLRNEDQHLEAVEAGLLELITAMGNRLPGRFRCSDVR